MLKEAYDSNYKIVIIGDRKVGKTCLLKTFTKDKFPKKYVPTTLDSDGVIIPVGDNKYVHLEIWEDSSDSRKSTKNNISFSECNFFIMCFSVVDPQSFQNIKKKHYSAIQMYNKGKKGKNKIPNILVGLKLGLREDPQTIKMLQKNDKEAVMKRQGLFLARDCNSVEYFEVDSMSKKGVKDVFSYVAKYLQKKENGGKKKKVKKFNLFQVSNVSVGNMIESVPDDYDENDLPSDSDSDSD